MMVQCIGLGGVEDKRLVTYCCKCKVDNLLLVIGEKKSSFEKIYHCRNGLPHTQLVNGQLFIECHVSMARHLFSQK
jgi:hypothetical protein